MRLASIFRLRLRSLFSRKKLEQELDEEFCYHLERQAQEEVRAGRRDMRNISYLEDFANTAIFSALDGVLLRPSP